MTAKRRSSRRRADVPPRVQADLNAGRIETANLVEALVVDCHALMRHVEPAVARAYAKLVSPTNGIVQKMAAAGRLLADHHGLAGFARLAAHPSDTVRGWAAYLLAAVPALTLAERFEHVRPLADDPHFGVREWAWLAVRPHLAADITRAISLLIPWTGETSANLRRFAVESTRPRGVWTAHIAALKTNPEPGRALLEPLAADQSRYVQDSVANWLNDASKTAPDWVREVLRDWQSRPASPATLRIIARAGRSLD